MMRGEFTIYTYLLEEDQSFSSIQAGSQATTQTTLAR